MDYFLGYIALLAAITQLTYQLPDNEGAKIDHTRTKRTLHHFLRSGHSLSDFFHRKFGKILHREPVQYDYYDPEVAEVYEQEENSDHGLWHDQDEYIFPKVYVTPQPKKKKPSIKVIEVKIPTPKPSTKYELPKIVEKYNVPAPYVSKEVHKERIPAVVEISPVLEETYSLSIPFSEHGLPVMVNKFESPLFIHDGVPVNVQKNVATVTSAPSVFLPSSPEVLPFQERYSVFKENETVAGVAKNHTAYVFKSLPSFDRTVTFKNINRISNPVPIIATEDGDDKKNNSLFIFKSLPNFDIKNKFLEGKQPKLKVNDLLVNETDTDTIFVFNSLPHYEVRNKFSEAILQKAGNDVVINHDQINSTDKDSGIFDFKSLPLFERTNEFSIGKLLGDVIEEEAQESSDNFVISLPPNADNAQNIHHEPIPQQLPSNRPNNGFSFANTPSKTIEDGAAINKNEDKDKIYKYRYIVSEPFQAYVRSYTLDPSQNKLQSPGAPVNKLNHQHSQNSPQESQEFFLPAKQPAVSFTNAITNFASIPDLGQNKIQNPEGLVDNVNHQILQGAIPALHASFLPSKQAGIFFTNDNGNIVPNSNPTQNKILNAQESNDNFVISLPPTVGNSQNINHDPIPQQLPSNIPNNEFSFATTSSGITENGNALHKNEDKDKTYEYRYVVNNPFQGFVRSYTLDPSQNKIQNPGASVSGLKHQNLQNSLQESQQFLLPAKQPAVSFTNTNSNVAPILDSTQNEIQHPEGSFDNVNHQNLQTTSPDLQTSFLPSKPAGIFSTNGNGNIVPNSNPTQNNVLNAQESNDNFVISLPPNAVNSQNTNHEPIPQQLPSNPSETSENESAFDKNEDGDKVYEYRYIVSNPFQGYVRSYTLDPSRSKIQSSGASVDGPNHQNLKSAISDDSQEFFLLTNQPAAPFTNINSNVAIVDPVLNQIQGPVGSVDNFNRQNLQVPDFQASFLPSKQAKNFFSNGNEHVAPNSNLVQSELQRPDTSINDFNQQNLQNTKSDLPASFLPFEQPGNFFTNRNGNTNPSLVNDVTNSPNQNGAFSNDNLEFETRWTKSDVSSERIPRFGDRITVQKNENAKIVDVVTNRPLISQTVSVPVRRKAFVASSPKTKTTSSIQNKRKRNKAAIAGLKQVFVDITDATLNDETSSFWSKPELIHTGGGIDAVSDEAKSPQNSKGGLRELPNNVLNNISNLETSATDLKESAVLYTSQQKAVDKFQELSGDKSRRISHLRTSPTIEEESDILFTSSKTDSPLDFNSASEENENRSLNQFADDVINDIPNTQTSGNEPGILFTSANPALGSGKLRTSLPNRIGGIESSTTEKTIETKAVTPSGVTFTYSLFFPGNEPVKNDSSILTSTDIEKNQNHVQSQNKPSSENYKNMLFELNNLPTNSTAEGTNSRGLDSDDGEDRIRYIEEISQQFMDPQSNEREKELFISRDENNSVDETKTEASGDEDLNSTEDSAESGIHQSLSAIPDETIYSSQPNKNSGEEGEGEDEKDSFLSVVTENSTRKFVNRGNVKFSNTQESLQGINTVPFVDNHLSSGRKTQETTSEIPVTESPLTSTTSRSRSRIHFRNRPTLPVITSPKSGDNIEETTPTAATIHHDKVFRSRGRPQISTTSTSSTERIILNEDVRSTTNEAVDETTTPIDSITHRNRIFRLRGRPHTSTTQPSSITEQSIRSDEKEVSSTITEAIEEATTPAGASTHRNRVFHLRGRPHSSSTPTSSTEQFIPSEDEGIEDITTPAAITTLRNRVFHLRGRPHSSTTPTSSTQQSTPIGEEVSSTTAEPIEKTTATDATTTRRNGVFHFRGRPHTSTTPTSITEQIISNEEDVRSTINEAIEGTTTPASATTHRKRVFHFRGRPYTSTTTTSITEQIISNGEEVRSTINEAIEETTTSATATTHRNRVFHPRVRPYTSTTPPSSTEQNIPNEEEESSITNEATEETTTEHRPTIRRGYRRRRPTIPSRRVLISRTPEAEVSTESESIENVTEEVSVTSERSRHTIPSRKILIRHRDRAYSTQTPRRILLRHRDRVNATTTQAPRVASASQEAVEETTEEISTSPARPLFRVPPRTINLRSRGRPATSAPSSSLTENIDNQSVDEDISQKTERILGGNFRPGFRIPPRTIINRRPSPFQTTSENSDTGSTVVGESLPVEDNTNVAEIEASKPLIRIPPRNIYRQGGNARPPIGIVRRPNSVVRQPISIVKQPNTQKISIEESENKESEIRTTLEEDVTSRRPLFRTPPRFLNSENNDRRRPSNFVPRNISRSTSTISPSSEVLTTEVNAEEPVTQTDRPRVRNPTRSRAPNSNRRKFVRRKYIKHKKLPEETEEKDEDKAESSQIIEHQETTPHDVSEDLNGEGPTEDSYNEKLPAVQILSTGMEDGYLMGETEEIAVEEGSASGGL